MKRIDFIKANKELLLFMWKNNVNPQDVTLVDMFSTAQAMIDRGEKTTYVASKVSSEYGLSDRSFYNVMRRMREEL